MISVRNITIKDESCGQVRGRTAHPAKTGIEPEFKEFIL
jgi:hypothetical protein